MRSFHYVAIVLSLLLLVTGAMTAEPTKSSTNGDINLIVRADDIGFCHAANAAIIDAYQNGIVQSTEIMAPCPWFMDAVRLLNENKGLDVGIHLTLNCEWANYKWGPVTNAKTLVNKDGYFYSRASELNSGNVDLNELEAELRAQIELVLKYVPHASHLSYHMDTALSKPEYKAIVEKLSREFNLPMHPANLTGSYEPWNVPVDEKEDFLVKKLNEFTPGNWMLIHHLALDVPETRALIGANAVYDADIHMPEHRAMELKLMKSEKIKKIIEERNIHLINYKDTFQGE